MDDLWMMISGSNEKDKVNFYTGILNGKAVLQLWLFIHKEGRRFTAFCRKKIYKNQKMPRRKPYDRPKNGQQVTQQAQTPQQVLFSGTLLLGSSHIKHLHEKQATSDPAMRYFSKSGLKLGTFSKLAREAQNIYPYQACWWERHNGNTTTWNEA